MSLANSSMEQRCNKMHNETSESDRTMLIKFGIALCEMKSVGLA